MIKLERGPAPDFYRSPKFFELNERLEKEFLDSTRQQRLNFNNVFIPHIKEALMFNFHQKCMYCETRLGGVEQATVDPFRPKSGARGLDKKKYAQDHYWWLYYNWDNMMLSCNTCNTRYKRDLFPVEDENFRAEVYSVGDQLLAERALLIDPCLEDPEQHLKFNSDGTVTPLSPKGQVTIEVLGLNRQSLVVQRSEKVVDLILKLKLLKKGKDTGNLISEVLVPYIEKVVLGSAEYSAVLRTVFTEWYESNIEIWNQYNISKENISSFIKPNIIKYGNDELIKISRKFDELKRFSIKSFTIDNFKSIDHLKIKLSASRDKEGENLESWLLVLGDNGIGKSSILQALSLALCGEKQLRKLNLNVMDYLKRGEKSGRVTIKSHESDSDIILSFDENGFKTNIKAPPTFILGYGSTRLLPKGRIEPDRKKEPYTNVRNLFDYSVSLEDPNLWLNELDEREFINRAVPAFYDVLALKGNDKLYREGGEIKIHRHNEEHLLEQTSDGYQTIVAVVADIMKTLSQDLASYHNSSGIVFIDEIGNHLHPRWRTKIVKALRKAFPKIQFIVTTHEPLCLRGLEHGEVVVLVRDKKHKVRCLGKKLLPDHSAMTVEQLLTSDLFGLLDVMDCDVEKSFEEYYDLLSKGRESWDDDQKTRFEELREEIQEKELLGTTPREQVYFELIDDIFAKSLREDGFKAKEELKKETVNIVKEMIKDKFKDIL